MEILKVRFYINDIAKCTKLLDFILFADDTTAFTSGKNANGVFRTVTSELLKLQNWLFANKLSLNTRKTNYNLFHKTNIADDLPLKFPKVSRGTLSVERVTKFLGIFLMRICRGSVTLNTLKKSYLML